MRNSRREPGAENQCPVLQRGITTYRTVRTRIVFVSPPGQLWAFRTKPELPFFPRARRDEGAAPAGADGKGRHSRESAVDGAGEARQSPRVT